MHRVVNWMFFLRRRCTCLPLWFCYNLKALKCKETKNAAHVVALQELCGTGTKQKLVSEPHEIQTHPESRKTAEIEKWKCAFWFLSKVLYCHQGKVEILRQKTHAPSEDSRQACSSHNQGCFVLYLIVKSSTKVQKEIHWIQSKIQEQKQMEREKLHVNLVDVGGSHYHHCVLQRFQVCARF